MNKRFCIAQSDKLQETEFLEFLRERFGARFLLHSEGEALLIPRAGSSDANGLVD